MTKIRRRKPQFEFVQILNAVARDYRVSWRARGLLVELLSYPAEYETSVDDLVKKAKRQGGNTEGRDAMRAAARELKAVGYIIETRHQDEHGRWRTELEVTDEPMYELLAQVDSISAGRTDDGFPGVGFPVVGFPGVSKKTEKKTEINSSPPVPSSPPGEPAPLEPPAGREDEAPPKTDGVLERAETLVSEAVRRWPSRHRAPGPRDRQRLSECVATELANGGDEAVILDELTRDLSDAGSALRVVLGNRTKTPGWGRSNDPRPDRDAFAATDPKPPWCGLCDERTRLVMAVREDGSEAMRRCPACHPELDSAPLLHASDAEREGLSDGARAAAAEARRLLAALRQ
ncbi:hypothetical protein EMG21_28140 [Klebsiella pneumoniae]|nr:hypothetical protein EMG21_28140 [Klebsiella pneumoniae]